MPSTRVLLFRHAETASPDLFHGAESDVGLGPRGYAQAESVARWLAGLRPDGLLSSPMRRALETARPIASACRLEIEVVPDLFERRMGPLSGASKATHWHVYESEKSRWMAGDLDATHPGAESFAMLRDRVVPAFLAAVEPRAGRTLAVVAHGIVIRALLTTLLDGSGPADFDRISIENAAINDLAFDGRRWEATALGRVVA